MPSPARPPIDSFTTPPRKSFALAGPSAKLDPLHDAVRSDLADIRLADRVFAPHYAQAVERFVTHPVIVRASRDRASAPLGVLQPGNVFEVLEFSEGQAWGVAPASSIVGYVDTEALSWVEP